MAKGTKESDIVEALEEFNSFCAEGTPVVLRGPGHCKGSCSATVTVAVQLLTDKSSNSE